MTYSDLYIDKLIFDYCFSKNIYISSNQSNMLMEYLFNLKKWNKHYNLTAINSLEDMAIYHVIDSLSILPYLDELFEKQNIKICDVGSGAGLPGIIISIMRPNWNIYCIDSIGKKTAFMQQTKNILGLSNLDIINSRVELFSDISFDLIVSRAFASLKKMVILTQHILEENGIICAMKGRVSLEEINDIRNLGDYFIDKIFDLNISHIPAYRSLVLLRKNHKISTE